MENLIDALILEDITVKRVVPGGKVSCPCPRCSHRKPGNNIEVKFDTTGRLAEWRCSNCLFTGKVGDVALAEKKAIEPIIQQQFAEPASASAEVEAEGWAGMPFKARDYLKAWGMTKAHVATAGAYWDEERAAISWPYREGGKVVNVKYEQLDGAVQFDRGAKPVFYAADQVAAQAGIIEIFITDNEKNQLALSALGLKNVIAAPKGVAASKEQAFQYVAHAADLLESASKITFVVAADKDGEDLKAELARRIGAGKCFITTYPEKCITITDVISRLGGDDALNLVHDSQRFPISGIYEVSQFEKSLEDYFDFGMAAGLSTGWENVDKLYTVMPNELDVVTGIPNHGKSEWLDALMINLAEMADWQFAIFSPEHSKEEHTTKLVEKRVQAPSDPKAYNRMTKDTYLEGVRWVARHFMFIVADDEDALPTLDWLLQRMGDVVLRYGVNGVVIDPWNEIEHSRPPGISETDYISTALSRLKRFARNHNVHVWVVAHPRIMRPNPKTGELSEPSLYDISGSAHWANKVDNGIVVHRPKSVDNITQVFTKKVKRKHVGRRGDTDMNYDLDTGRYSPAPTSISSAPVNGEMPLDGDSGITILEAP